MYSHVLAIFDCTNLYWFKMYLLYTSFRCAGCVLQGSNPPRILAAHELFAAK